MKLKRFLLRYYPPGNNFAYFVLSHFIAVLKFLYVGVILEYELRDKTREMKEIDLLHLTPEYVYFFLIPGFVYV